MCGVPPARADRVRHRARRPRVVEDVRARLLRQEVLGEHGGEEVAVDEPAGVVDEEAAVGVAVPCDAEVGALREHRVDDELPVLLEHRVGLAVREVAVRRPVRLDQVERQLVQQRTDHRAAHAVAAVGDDLHPLDVRRVDELHRTLLEVRADVDVLRRPAAGRIGHALLHHPADVLDARVAGQGDRTLAHQLRARVGGGVVRGGAHEPAVEAPGADEEVQHLGPDLADVQHVGALGLHAGAVAGGEGGRGEAHVAAEAEPQLGDGLAGEVRDHAREAATDLLGDVLVDLLAVQAADVVGLEDLAGNGHRVTEPTDLLDSMAGHSKWAGIKHKKAIVDARRGKLFTKLARAITVAAKEGGGDVDGNPSLALAVQKAKDASMPKDNIERAIAKGTGAGADAAALETVLYEGYGPGGVALLVEAVTDNRNRTGSEVRHMLSKGGGSLGEPGSVGYLFDKRGVIVVDAAAYDEDDLMPAIEAGAEDVTVDDDVFEVLTEPVATSPPCARRSTRPASRSSPPTSPGCPRAASRSTRTRRASS